MINDQLWDFVNDSNHIEGIKRAPLQRELDATALFISLPAIRATDVAALVRELEPSAELRLRPGLDVRVGNHIPPPGGPAIGQKLEDLLAEICAGIQIPFAAHWRYENLHPFTDGNGRSGRAIWLWQMMHERRTRLLNLSFLHAWYYQSLDAQR